MESLAFLDQNFTKFEPECLLIREPNKSSVTFFHVTVFFNAWHFGFEIGHGLQGVPRVCFSEVITGISLLSLAWFTELVTG